MRRSLRTLSLHSMYNNSFVHANKSTLRKQVRRVDGCYVDYTKFKRVARALPLP